MGRRPRTLDKSLSKCRGLQPKGVTDSKRLVVPLEPDTANLKETHICMHGSETTGYDTGKPYNEWFSECLGLDVELLYVGLNRRRVLGNLSPNSQTAGHESSWTSLFQKAVTRDDHEQGLGLSDVAAVLVVSETSLDHVTRRLPEGMKGDIRKFRPNIVISGAETEFAEDYWRELDNSGNKVLLTQNCNRCVSLNLDYDSGTFSTGPEGKVLANLSKDRHIDPGARYSPTFGRYGFFHRDAHQKNLVVGDKVKVTGTNGERTTFSKHL